MKTLPLGIDCGSANVRVAALERTRDGYAVREVVSHPRHGTPADDIARAVAALGGRERRAIFGLHDARLFEVALPPMPPHERDAAARFEALALVEESDDAVTVCTRTALFASAAPALVGIAPRAAIAALRADAERAKLRLCALEHAPLAWRRLLPDADAVLDVGAHAATLHVLLPGVPRSVAVGGGGDDVTIAIARDLGIPREAAEERKRAIGCAGAGETAFAALVERCVEAIRYGANVSIRRLYLAGNGVRVRGFRDALQARLEAQVAMLDPAVLGAHRYPRDIAAAAMPDWGFAVALATATLLGEAAA